MNKKKSNPYPLPTLFHDSQVRKWIWRQTLKFRYCIRGSKAPTGKRFLPFFGQASRWDIFGEVFMRDADRMCSNLGSQFVAIFLLVEQRGFASAVSQPFSSAAKHMSQFFFTSACLWALLVVDFSLTGLFLLDQQSREGSFAQLYLDPISNKNIRPKKKYQRCLC